MTQEQDEQPKRGAIHRNLRRVVAFLRSNLTAAIAGVLVTVIAVCVAFFAVPIARIFEDSRDRVERMGYDWNDSGFYSALERSDRDAITLFIEGGYVFPEDLLMRVLQGQDRRNNGIPSEDFEDSILDMLIQNRQLFDDNGCRFNSIAESEFVINYRWKDRLTPGSRERAIANIVCSEGEFEDLVRSIVDNLRRRLSDYERETGRQIREYEQRLRTLEYVSSGSSVDYAKLGILDGNERNYYENVLVPQYRNSVENWRGLIRDLEEIAR